jgi:hypothetical protein|tara:strand:- start:2511 stop:2879 length:369 start_codon:yes stop_codon:yes gene_type:complete
MTDQHIKQTIALANPEMQLHMLASWTDMPPVEVLATARVHATFALKQAEAILRTAGCSDEDSLGYVAYLRDNPHPLLDVQTKRKQDALWWEARLWEVADGDALTAKEAQALADWVVEPMVEA